MSARGQFTFVSKQSEFQSEIEARHTGECRIKKSIFYLEYFRKGRPGYEPTISTRAQGMGVVLDFRSYGVIVQVAGAAIRKDMPTTLDQRRVVGEEHKT
jgi:hypothetical protein